MITRQDVVNKLISYLGHRISLEELVGWAENVMMEGEFEEHDLPLLRDIVARLGLSDTLAFGLSWEDCRNFLRSLGYDVEVRVTRLASNQ
ncbi:Uncharacterized [Moorella glycerini]|uniref:MafI family immunity protein n=1 Tax=Neomoorella stamsii TaxID=1266720 RepID=A0A9X7J4I9_9FIRM|nr:MULTISPECIES: hypothetical protein [Moorella]PRR76281.1 hypothetical protein MOST_04420 [Moorella stamsii]CEP67151.1 Uncharacterized [Moorella glycerini]